MWKLFDRTGRRTPRNVTPPRRPARVQLEPLEPRVMMTGGLPTTLLFSIVQGNLDQYNSGTGVSTVVDRGVSSYQIGNVGSTRLLVERTDYGALREYDGTNLTNVDTGVRSFAVGSWAGNGYLVDLTSAGSLKTSTGSGWTTQDSNVQSFAPGAWAGKNYLVDLTSYGALKTSYGSGWTTQDTAVRSFAWGPGPATTTWST